MYTQRDDLQCQRGGAGGGTCRRVNISVSYRGEERRGVGESCACNWPVGNTGGVAYKEGHWEQLDGPELDTVALRRGILTEENDKADCTEGEDCAMAD